MQPPKTLAQALEHAIRDHDAARVGRLVDFLRFRCRANYDDCLEIAQGLTGIDEADWDELLFEADMLDSAE